MLDTFKLLSCNDCLNKYLTSKSLCKALFYYRVTEVSQTFISAGVSCNKSITNYHLFLILIEEQNIVLLRWDSKTFKQSQASVNSYA